jgi:antitoxin MazE
MDMQIAKWGNSLALRIPAEIARRFGLRSGDTVDAQVTLDGALTIRTGRWSRSAFAAELEQARATLPAGTPVVEVLRRDARY